MQDASSKQQTEQKYKANHQQTGLPPHSALPIRGKTNKQKLSTVAHQASPSMGFSRQEYWSGLPFPSPGDLPDPGIEPRSPALQADALTFELPAKTTLYKAPQTTGPTFGGKTPKGRKNSTIFKERIQLSLKPVKRRLQTQ